MRVTGRPLSSLPDLLVIEELPELRQAGAFEPGFEGLPVDLVAVSVC
tara:strand:+ start:498 stop:638 length:141 start_codon:yes stop_codon:yes gene_type:complete